MSSVAPHSVAARRSVAAARAPAVLSAADGNVSTAISTARHGAEADESRGSLEICTLPLWAWGRTLHDGRAGSADTVYRRRGGRSPEKPHALPQEDAGALAVLFCSRSAGLLRLGLDPSCYCCLPAAVMTAGCSP